MSALSTMSTAARTAVTLLAATVVAAMALTLVAVLGPAGAQEAEPEPAPEATERPDHEERQAEIEACLSDAGIAVPERIEGQRPDLTDAEHVAIRDALAECGIEGYRGWRAYHRGFRDGFRAGIFADGDLAECLAGQGIEVPAPTDGERPNLTDEDKDAMRAALAECGIEAPNFDGGRSGARRGHGFGGDPAAMAEFRDCMAEAGFERPEPGTSRDELGELDHEALRTAAELCRAALADDANAEPSSATDSVENVLA